MFSLSERWREWLRVCGAVPFPILWCLFCNSAAAGATAPYDDPAVAGNAHPDLQRSAAPPQRRNPERDAYFGDLHVHTMYSFDAFIFGARATPDDAYRFARGESILHPAGFEMTLPAALDFLAVTDHGMYLGMLPAMADPASDVADHELSVAVREIRTARERSQFYARKMVPWLLSAQDDDLYDSAVSASAWAQIIASAERYNAPGEFTTFIGYEYTSTDPGRRSLHRNIIYRGSDAPDAPFTALDSRNPEDLWDWMDGERSQGRELLAIPHNSNGSDGRMFELARFDGTPLGAEDVEQRMRNEPLVEITQVKGTSETHPALSPNDEWADFEVASFQIADGPPSRPAGSYVRDALRKGIALEESEGLNPFRFGFIGSSDTHVGAGSYEESNYWGKVGLLDATGRRRGSLPLEPGAAETPVYAQNRMSEWGASGLAGVWAESNTRQDIYDALRRKETFATSGPRIRVRFFAGYGFPDDLVSRDDAIAQAYARGVPMGGDILGRAEGAPQFFVWAMRDARSAPLQRVQVIKGWASGSGTRERVYDVACADGLNPDPQNHRCPDNGASVDLETCRINEGRGGGEMITLWQDPDFDHAQRAFYYVRVLENPSCRWSTWDALRAGVEPRADLPATIQERAWSSPIWYVPPGLAQR